MKREIHLWVLCGLWLAFMTIVGPVLISYPDSTLVVLGFVLFCCLSRYTFHVFIKQTREENEHD